jgi:TatA/E family protein of Tat protein translocase
MFDIGLQEMVVIGVIALLVFGPSRLPELGRKLGRLMREFRRASDEFRSTVETNLHINDPDPIPAPSAATSVPEDSPVAEVEAPSAAEPSPSGVSASPAEQAEPYCGRRGARLVHRRECAWVARIPEADRLYWKRLGDAEGEGFVRCPACEPWEPA